MNGELSEIEMEHGCWPKQSNGDLPLMNFMVQITTADGATQYPVAAPSSIDAALIGMAIRFPGCAEGHLPKCDMKISVTLIKQGAKDEH